MNSLQIEYFLTLTKYLNFTDTAKALYVSQPAISKQIAALEKEIGFTLFFRSNRNVSLTPAGMIYLKTFTQINELYNEAQKQAQAIYSEQSSKIRLGCVEGMELSNLLSKVFTSFSTQFPNIQYHLERHTPQDLVKALYNDDLDVAITLEPFSEDKPDLSRIFFLKAKHLLFVSVNNSIIQKDNFSITDLQDETLISLAPDIMPSADKSIADFWEKNGFYPKRMHYVPNVESLMLSAEVGLGVAFGDTLLRLCNSPLLRSFELNTSHNIYLVWKKNTTNLLIPSFAKLVVELSKTMSAVTSPAAAAETTG